MVAVGSMLYWTVAVANYSVERVEERGLTDMMGVRENLRLLR